MHFDWSFMKNLVIPLKFKKHSPHLHKKGKAWGILAVSKITPTYKSRRLLMPLNCAFIFQWNSYSNIVQKIRAQPCVVNFRLLKSL